MADTAVAMCLNVLKRDDVKKELKHLASPLIEPILDHLYPYIYISLVFVIISFFLHLGIFILLVRNKSLLLNLN